MENNQRYLVWLYCTSENTNITDKWNDNTQIQAPTHVHTLIYLNKQFIASLTQNCVMALEEFIKEP